MSRVHKLVILAAGSQALPASRLLSVDWQGRDLCLWFETGDRMHEVIVVPTGSDAPDDAEYIGTAQTTEFAGEGFPFMVFHVYSRPSR